MSDICKTQVRCMILSISQHTYSVKSFSSPILTAADNLRIGDRFVDSIRKYKTKIRNKKPIKTIELWLLFINEICYFCICMVRLYV